MQLVDAVGKDGGRRDVTRVEEVVDVMIRNHHGVKSGEEPIESRWLF